MSFSGLIGKQLEKASNQAQRWLGNKSFLTTPAGFLAWLPSVLAFLSFQQPETVRLRPRLKSLRFENISIKEGSSSAAARTQFTPNLRLLPKIIKRGERSIWTEYQANLYTQALYIPNHKRLHLQKSNTCTFVRPSKETSTQRRHTRDEHRNGGNWKFSKKFLKQS